MNVISFARGAASVDLVDVDGLRAAADEAMASASIAAAVGYGTGWGFQPLREWIAAQHAVELERVIATNGSMQAGAMLMAEVVGRGDIVVVEDPTYDRTLLNLRERGAVIRPIATDADGIDVDAIADLVAGGEKPKLVHVIPTFQNPGGSTLSEARRRQLAALAEAHDFLVLEDDPYRLLRFRGTRQPLMVDMAPGHVVHASSFSKTACPGIRVGYLVGPPDVIRRVYERAVKTYISPNLVAQAIVHRFCERGSLDASIGNFREKLQQRLDVLVGGLERELPDARFTAPEGGYFLWVQMPEGFDAGAFARRAAQAGVAMVPGTDFTLDGGENAFRLAYSGVTPEEIDQGVAILRSLARATKGTR